MLLKALIKDMTLTWSACMLSQETRNSMLFQGNSGSDIIRKKSKPQKKKKRQITLLRRLEVNIPLNMT